MRFHENRTTRLAALSLLLPLALGTPARDASAAIDPETIAAGIKAAQAALDFVKNNLFAARSVVVEVDNNTASPLVLAKTHHAHGGFAVSPRARVEPTSYDVFGSVSKGFATGTEGFARYTLADGVSFRVDWNNPFAGKNKCDVDVTGDGAYRYVAIKGCGSGNTGAHMRFQLFDETPRYAAVWRKNTGGETQRYGWALEHIAPEYDRLRALGWRLESLQSYVWSGKSLFNAVFRPGRFEETAVFGWTYDDFRALYDQIWADGWRLHQINVHTLASDVRYSAVWRKNPAEGEWQSYAEPAATVAKTTQDAFNEGWRLHTVQPYVYAGQTYYLLVFKPGAWGQAFVPVDDIANFAATYRMLAQDGLWGTRWRLYSFVPFVAPGPGHPVKYAAVWRPSEAPELFTEGKTYRDYRSKYDTLWGEGWRLTQLVTY